MKLRNKMILFTVLICIVSIFAVSGINYMISIKNLTEEVNEKVQLETGGIAKDIDKWIALQKNSIYEVVENMVVVNDFEQDSAYNYLSVANDRNPGNSYYMAFSNKTYIDSTGWVPESSYDPTSRDWYLEAIDNEDFYVSEPYVDEMTGDMVVTISKAFETLDHNKGVISTDILINFLVDFIANVELDEEGSYAFLIDNKGNLVTHLNDEFNPTEDQSTNITTLLDGDLNPIIEENLSIRQKKVKDYDGIDRLFFFDDISESNWKVGVAVSADFTLRTINYVIKYTIIATIIILIIAILASLLMSNSITKPIIHSVQIAKNIGNLNLLDNIDEKDLNRKDEIGQMYNSFQDIIKKLKIFIVDLESSIRTNHQVYEETISELTNLVDQAEGTSATTEELSAGMEETSAATISINQSTGEIDRAVGDFASKIEEASFTSNELSTNADKLSTQFIHAKDNTMNQYGTTRENIQEAIESSKEVNQINVLSNAILAISEETSLLSLNAAIEAARAGESGRGFAVVAEEIRKLSENSNETVGEIQLVTQVITKAVNQLVSNTSSLIDFVENDVMNDYVMMVEAVKQYKDDGSSLNNIVSDLSATSEELTATINQISISMNEISITVEESTIATTDIAEKNMNIVEAVNNINNITQKNKEISDKLQQIVSQVKL